MSTNNNNAAQTLFRFVSLRNPQLTETKDKNVGFIHRPSGLDSLFDRAVKVVCEVSVIKQNGENLYTGDFFIPPSLNTTIQKNKVDVTDISLGEIMYNDGFITLQKNLGKEFDGIYGLYVKNSSYAAYGGESINLTKFKKAMEGKLITEENVIEAIKQIHPYKLAKSKGFDKIELKTTMEEFTIDIDNNINNLTELKVIYRK